MIKVNDQFSIREDEIAFSAIRASGPGGQNVNKVSSAVHLRFDIAASSLPEHIRQRLLALSDRRITADGVIVIKARSHRTLEKNRADATARLIALLDSVCSTQRKRIPTKPRASVRKKRLDDKKKRGALKQTRSSKIQY